MGVILARGGSKGIPRKNLKKLLGKPLLAYTIDAAMSAERLDRVVLSTDDEEIAAVGREHGVEIIFRPAEYGTDEAPMHWAVRHAVRVIEQKGEEVEIIVPLYANVPIRKKGIIDKVIEKLISSGADSVQTYAPYQTPPQWAYRIEGDKPYPMEGCFKPVYRRQDLIPAYHPDGAVIALRYDVLMQSEKAPMESDAFLGSDRRAVVQAPEDTVDVDEPFDLQWAEFLLRRARLSPVHVEESESR
jgi:CMP-N-acetylneuraminic acid synthetase